MRTFAVLLLASTCMLRAQTAPAPAPGLSTAERIALRTCEKTKQDAQKQWQDATRQEQSIMVEFSAEHPGYHLNAQSFAVEPDAPKPAQPKPASPGTPAPKKK